MCERMVCWQYYRISNTNRNTEGKMSEPVEVRVSALRKLYDNRKNDTDTLEINGLKFVPSYLKYVLLYLKDKQSKFVLFTQTEGGTGYDSK